MKTSLTICILLGLTAIAPTLANPQQQQAAMAQRMAQQNQQSQQQQRQRAVNQQNGPARTQNAVNGQIQQPQQPQGQPRN